MPLWVKVAIALAVVAIIVGIAREFGDMMFNGLEEDGDSKKPVRK